MSEQKKREQIQNVRNFLGNNKIQYIRSSANEDYGEYTYDINQFKCHAALAKIHMNNLEIEMEKARCDQYIESIQNDQKYGRLFVEELLKQI